MFNTVFIAVGSPWPAGFFVFIGHFCFVSSSGLCLLLPFARGQEDHEVPLVNHVTRAHRCGTLIQIRMFKRLSFALSGSLGGLKLSIFVGLQMDDTGG